MTRASTRTVGVAVNRVKLAAPFTLASIDLDGIFPPGHRDPRPATRAPDRRTDHAAALSRRERKERALRGLLTWWLACFCAPPPYPTAVFSVHPIALHPEG
ncbi:unnamed protein product [Pleuronectes platessa]|uniref:Uncharacterized protein n=1 Tax=Pleuronectes platessa TaxID=8262 RepID=A0A9N7VQK1_PLEPL|nr:unnamed protein product [Pleuronectes platessa]